MIINIRGTNGAGKTHLVRRLMQRLGGPGVPVTAQHPVKMKPFVYCVYYNNVSFMGRYDVQNGGCDTLKWKGDAEWMTEEIIRQSATHHVVFEGLIASKWATARYLAMKRANVFAAVLLNTSLEECLGSVNARRRERGVEEPVNPSQLRDKHMEALGKMRRDQWAGLDVRQLSREDAFAFCCEKLGLTSEAP